jgi:FMS-like tyrosine kinase 1
VLWELFSLGQTPYPGMEANQSLFHKIRDGYRMEKPKLASQEIYEIMLECWRVNPKSRPTFTELEQKMGALLHETVKEVSQSYFLDFCFLF